MRPLDYGLSVHFICTMLYRPHYCPCCVLPSVTYGQQERWQFCTGKAPTRMSENYTDDELIDCLYLMVNCLIGNLIGHYNDGVRDFSPTVVHWHSLLFGHGNRLSSFGDSFSIMYSCSFFNR